MNPKKSKNLDLMGAGVNGKCDKLLIVELGTGIKLKVWDGQSVRRHFFLSAVTFTNQKQCANVSYSEELSIIVTYNFLKTYNAPRLLKIGIRLRVIKCGKPKWKKSSKYFSELIFLT